MSEHILENEALRARVDDRGAELISVYDKARGVERIWTGEAAVWNRHAPILFPFVGKVTGGKYRVGEREYPMPTQHGFARDLDFECVQARDDAVTHALTDSAWTRERYPYAFRLTVSHRLEGRRLVVGWTVENRGAERMFFSIGGHPGFMMPGGARKEECGILFPGAEALRYIGVSKEGFALPEVKTLSLRDGRAGYQADIPDTWIFEDGQVKKVGIAGPDGAAYVMMDCGQFPMLAVWANPDGPFICLEPWFGRCDDEGFTGTMDQKKGVQKLASGGKREISYSIDF